jgi:hypothetical protein
VGQYCFEVISYLDTNSGNGRGVGHGRLVLIVRLGHVAMLLQSMVPKSD